MNQSSAAALKPAPAGDGSLHIAKAPRSIPFLVSTRVLLGDMADQFGWLFALIILLVNGRFILGDGPGFQWTPDVIALVGVGLLIEALRFPARRRTYRLMRFGVFAEATLAHHDRVNSLWPPGRLYQCVFRVHGPGGSPQSVTVIDSAGCGSRGDTKLLIYDLDNLQQAMPFERIYGLAGYTPEGCIVAVRRARGWTALLMPLLAVALAIALSL